MARRSAGGSSKSEAIRAYKSSHGSAGPKEIAAALGENGVKVSPAFVSTVLSNARRKGKKGGRKGVRRGGRPRRSDAYASLVQANKLANEMGGIDKARAALDALARILG